jgi:hypothetical protein
MRASAAARGRLAETSFGTLSAAGSRFVETMLSVMETCRQQHRHVFECLAAAVAVTIG